MTTPVSSTHPEPTHPEPNHPSSGRAPLPSSPPKVGWLTRRRDERGRRRAVAGVKRLEHSVVLLGPQWHIVDYHPEDPDFLAIGPGGIFQVTVCDHGRSRVELAGEVVQVNGRRFPYVSLARRDAERISQQMSMAAGRRIPVVPVVAFLGSGSIVYYGRPPDGIVLTSYNDIGRALQAHGNRISQTTIEKLLIVAGRVDTATIGQYLDV
jgi:hypothetical protein